MQHQQQHQQQQQQQHQHQQTQTATIRTTNVRPQSSRFSLAEKRKRTLKYIGISETVISIACFILGGLVFSVLRSYFVEYDYYYGVSFNAAYSLTIGEGIWASVLPFIAGIFGIVAGGKQSNKCKLQAHLGLAIVSAISSFILFITSLMFNLVSYNSTDGYKAILGMITILSFINFILFIVSAAYTCALLPNCGCCNDGNTREMVTVTTTDQQFPVMHLAPPSGQQIIHPQQFTNVHNGAIYQNQMTSSNSGQPMTSYVANAPPMVSTSLPFGGQQNMMTSYAVTGHDQQVMTKQQPPAYQPTH